MLTHVRVRHQVCLHVPNATGDLKCMDNGGSTGGSFPDGPHEIHMCVDYTIATTHHRFYTATEDVNVHLHSLDKLLERFALHVSDTSQPVNAYLHVARWGQEGVPSSQDWVFNKAEKQFSDPMRNVCLTSADGKYVAIWPA